jgi:hypothetical protein
MTRVRERPREALEGRLVRKLVQAANGRGCALHNLPSLEISSPDGAQVNLWIMSAESSPRRPVSQRWLRAALALCLSVAGVGTAADSAVAIGLPTAAAGEVVPGATVTVAPTASGLVRPEQDLRVAVVITNTGGEPLPKGSARLMVAESRFETSAEYGAWLIPREDSELPAGVDVGSRDVPGLARGASTRSLVFTVASDRLDFLLDDPWGAHAIWVQFESGDETVLGRSSIVWAPTKAPGRAGLATAMPLTVPPTETGLIEADDLARYTGAAGILTRQLDAAESRQIAIGIDPMILASIRVLGSAAPASAVEWLARLSTLPNDTFALAYGDTDLTSVTQAGSALLAPQNFDFAVDPALFLTPEETPTETPTDAPGQTPPASPAPTVTATPTDPDATPQPTGSASPTAEPEPGEPDVPTTEELLAWDYTIEGIAWPSDGTVTRNDLDAFAETGLTTTILAEGNVNESSRSTQAHTRFGDVDALTADSVLSTLFRDAVSARTTEEWRGAVAAMGAALAVVTTEHTGPAPLSLATLDRSLFTSAFRVDETLDALKRMTWVAATPVPELLERPARSTQLLDRPVDADRLRVVGRLLRAHAAEGDFATIAEDPTDITAERRLQALGLLSQSWRVAPDAWLDQVGQFRGQSTALRKSVQLVESSQVNLLSDLERLPVSISNALDVPVTVFVNVRSQSPELVVRENHVEVLVEPESTARQFVIPVRSLANGEATIVVSLVSRTGEPIGKPTVQTVNAQAGWGAAGTLVFGSLVVGLLAIGLYRTFGRGRRGKPDTGSGAGGADG